MSNQFSPSRLLSRHNKGKMLAFMLAPQGSSTPKILSGAGVATVTRNSAGNYTVKLQDQYRGVLDAQVATQAAAPTTSTVPYTVIQGLNVLSSGTGAKTVTVQCYDTVTGNAIDMPANAGNTISIELFLKDAAY